MSSVATVSKLLDALAEHRGIEFTAEQKMSIVKEFTGYLTDGEDLENEWLASHFLDELIRVIRKQGRFFIEQVRESRLQDEKSAELDAGLCNF